MSVGVTPSLHAHFSIFGGLTSAEFALTGTASTSLSATVHASSGCTLNSTPLLAHPLHIATFAGAIGPVPVVVTLQGQLYIDASLAASADATSGLSATASITGGVAYSKGRFSPILAGPNASFKFNPPTLGGNAQASAHVEPALQALLYGVAGPQLSVTTGPEFKADTASSPWWTLDAPFKVQASLTAPVLNLNSGKLTLYSHTFHITDAGGPLGGGSSGGGAGGGGGGGGTAISPAPGTIAAGDYNTCALVTSGGVDCWGENEAGQLGNGTTNGIATPVAVTGLAHAATMVSVSGSNDACAALATGTVECWGSNQTGNLGVGTSVGPEACSRAGGASCSTAAVAVTGISNATGVSTGDNNSCAVITGGEVQCWGASYDGMLGNGSTSGPDNCGGGTENCSTTPLTVSGLANVTAVSTGSQDACALTASGSIECWGYGRNGQLGDGTEPAYSAVPVTVSGIIDAKAIAVGDALFSCAVLKTGAVDCWGENSGGELGNGTDTGAPCGGPNDACSTVPVPVSGITDAVAVSAGYDHACALLASGSVECWGVDNSEDLGSTGGNSDVPVPVAGVANATAITAGGAYSCALIAGGQMDCWGTNNYGQLGNGTVLTTGVPTPVWGSGFG